MGILLTDLSYGLVDPACASTSEDKMSNTNNSKHKMIFPLGQWFKRVFFGPHKELSFMEEEALQSPLRTIVDNFFSKKLSVFGLVVFILIFLFVMLGPIFVPIDLSYQDNTQINVAPGST